MTFYRRGICVECAPLSLDVSMCVRACVCVYNERICAFCRSYHIFGLFKNCFVSYRMYVCGPLPMNHPSYLHFSTFFFRLQHFLPKHFAILLLLGGFVQCVCVFFFGIATNKFVLSRKYILQFCVCFFLVLNW